jgi:protein ImuA
LTLFANSREQEQKQNNSVASRVDRGFRLVAGGESRAAEEELRSGKGRDPVPSAMPACGTDPKAIEPGLAPGSILSELFPSSPRDAGWTGFVLAQLEPAKPLLWVQERMAICEGGRVHAAGLGAAAKQLIHVEARDAKAALWAMEEGLRCPALGGVVGELWGDPQALDFTATRRLAVAAERSGVACWLIRLQGTANLSGARERWRLASAPGLTHPFDPKAPGSPRWTADLFRSRRRLPGQWVVGGDAPDMLLVAAQPADRALGQWQRRA